MKLILLTKHNKFLSLPSMMVHMDDVHVETEYFYKRKYIRRSNGLVYINS